MAFTLIFCLIILVITLWLMGGTLSKAQKKELEDKLKNDKV